tara:strand:- start:288787 stop:288891 length:105 start_codon:yes stop_codon:yes gene_type:complete
MANGHRIAHFRERFEDADELVERCLVAAFYQPGD